MKYEYVKPVEGEAEYIKDGSGVSHALADVSARTAAEDLAVRCNKAESGITALEGKCDKAESDITELEGKCDDAEYYIKRLESGQDYINLNLESLSNELGFVTRQAEENRADIDVLKGDGEGSVEKTVTDRIAEVVANAPEDLNTLKEIAEWITNHKGSASEMNASINKNSAAIEELPKKFLEKTTSYYDKNAVDDNKVENVGKPVYFGNKVIHNNDLFTHKILPELPDKQYTIGMSNLPYYGGYFKNVYADGLYYLNGNPYGFIPIELRCTEYRYISEEAPDEGQSYVTAEFTSTMTYGFFQRLYFDGQVSFNLFGLKERTHSAPAYVKISPDDSYTFYPQVGLVTDETDKILSIKFTIRDSGFTRVGNISETLVPIEDFVIALQESVFNNSYEITLLRSDYESQIETLYDIINSLQKRIESLENRQIDTPDPPDTGETGGDTRDYNNVFNVSNNDGLVRGQQSIFNAKHTSTSFQVRTGDEIYLYLSYGLHCDGIQSDLEYELYGDASLSCLGESINLGLNYSKEPNGSGSGRTSGSNNKTFTVTDTDNGKYIDVSVHADQPMGSSGGSVLHGAINTLTAEVKVNGNKVYSIST